MKRRKKAPYIFLFVLLCIFILILGVNIGKAVEQKNKEISYKLSNPPTRPPSITPTSRPLMFETYTNENCGVQFLYPSSLTLAKESSTSADFKENKSTALLVSCDRVNSLSATINDKSIKSEDITLVNKTIPAKVTTNNNREYYSFLIQNPLSRKNVSISIQKTIYPLFKESFQFIQGEL